MNQIPPYRYDKEAEARKRKEAYIQRANARVERMMEIVTKKKPRFVA